MSVHCVQCDESISRQIERHPSLLGQNVVELSLPISASRTKIDLLVAGPETKQKLHLAATVSDWKLPPVTLIILKEGEFDDRIEELEHHPRVGRSVFFCRKNEKDIQIGLDRIFGFHEKRESLKIDNSISGYYCQNNVSPRWLFHTLMENLDEYIYFKDTESRFLAVSQYLINKCGKETPAEVLDRTDYDLFEKEHSDEAFADEMRIVKGEITEIHKEEKVPLNGRDRWVISRKLPLYTRSKFLAGSYGLSRDISEDKELQIAFEKNHERMQAELLLARNLQETLLKQEIPEFLDDSGKAYLEIATKHIPSFHLSGDFYSITETPEGGAAIMIADVMGHGVRAAIVAAMVQITVKQLSDFSDQPAEFLTRLNRIIHQTILPTGETIFATAAYCYLEPDRKTLRFAQAGARHVIQCSANNTEDPNRLEDQSVGPAVGLFPESNYTEGTLTLESNDQILLYTDGILEAAREGEEFGEKRFLEFLKNHSQEELKDLINGILESVCSFTDRESLNDDVCLIALRVL